MGRQVIFRHYLTYFVQDKYIYIYISYGNKFPRVGILIVGILSYILCFELIHHFREIFNATLGVPKLVADGEIQSTCLASNLSDNS